MTVTASNSPAIQEGKRRLSALRQGMRALLDSVAGGTQLRTLLDVERVAGLHRKLAWQVHRLCQPGDSVADARFLPSRSQLRRFVEALRERGGNAEIADVVERRYDEVEAFVDDVCGSWTSFESMVSDADREAASEVTSKQREAMYEATSHLYGIRTATRFCCNIVAPSSGSDDNLDFIHVDGFIGLHRQRGTKAWPVNRLNYKFKDSSGNWRPPVRMEVFDEDTYRRHGVALMPEFCTQPLPGLEVVQAPQSDAGQILAVFHDVGLGAAADLVFGLTLRKADDRGNNLDVLGNRAVFGIVVEVPCKTLISDVLLHKSVDFGRPHVSTLRVDVDLPAFQVQQMRTHELPILETIEEAGEGIALLVANDAIPNYRAILDRCFARTQHAADEFRAWRCIVRYPIMSTITSVRFALSPTRAISEEPGRYAQSDQSAGLADKA